MINKIKNLSHDFYKEAIKIRQHLHKYPELSFNETKTSAYISGKLEDFGIPYKKGYARNGIIARIEGKNPGKKTIALRADMDALPVQEKNDLEFISKNKGVMHACGHDVHMTCLLGASAILNQVRDEFEGTVILIFQPAEEYLPGGAKQMLEEGALDGSEPDAILALHVQPDLPAGVVGFRPGKYMASTDEIYITVRGKGGHGAMPFQLIDPVLIASHLIVSLQQIVSRGANADTPTVLSFGKVIANGATNVIPDRVKIEGTFRTMDEEWREEVHHRIIRMSKDLSKSMGGDCDIEIRKGYPVLINNVELTKKSRNLAKKYLGKESVLDLGIRMTAEDFAYFAQKYPGCFFRLGVGFAGEEKPAGLHSSSFMVNEKSVETGMGLMAWLAINHLK
jgi:amidohydrolase